MAYLPPGGGRMNVTIGSNTAGVGTLISTGTLALAGGNNITLSQNGANGLTIHGGAAGGSNTFGMSNLGNTSGTSGVVSGSAVQYAFAGGNNITLSQSINAASATLTISAPNQSAQTANFYVSSNSTQLSSTAGIDLRSVSFQGAGIASVGVSQGKVLISVPSGGGAAGVALANSETTYTSGTVNLVGDGQVSVYSGGAGANQSYHVSIPGTSSLSATGAFNISTNGATISMGVPAFSAGMSSSTYGGSTGGTSGTASNQLVLAAGSNITLSQSTGAGGNTLAIYGPSTVVQTNQTIGLYATGANTTGQSSSNTIDARSFSISAQGGLYAGMSGNTLQLSAATTYAASNHSHGNPTLNLTNLSGTTASASNGLTLSLSAAAPGGGAGLSAGTQSVSTGTVNFANSNGISFGMSGSNQITASYTVPNVPVQTNQTLAYSAGNNTSLTSAGTFDARSMFLNAYGNVSAGFSSSSMFISAPVQSVQTQQNIQALVGGTVAATASTGTVTFANSNGVSFGMNGNTMTASVAAAGGVAIITSNTTYSTGSVELSNAGGALTIATAAGQKLNFSVPSVSSLTYTGAVSLVTAGNNITISGIPFTAGMSTGGNTAGTTGTVSNQLIFAGSNGILLSQATGAGGNTLSIGQSPQSQWTHNSAAMYSSSTSNMAITSASLVRMMLPNALSFSRVDIPISISGATSATANTAAMALTAVGVIYSRNASTLNAIVGQSSNTTYSYASNTGAYSSITGPRVMSFNLATSLSAGEYFFGFQMSSATSSVGTATTNLGWTVAPVFGTSNTVAPWTDMGAATNQTVNPYQPLQGINSVSISNTSQTHQQSQITQFGTAAARANLVVVLRNN